MGSSEQEKWVAAHLARVNIPLQVDVGTAFDFHLGHVNRAPVCMQKMSMEWVYRVLQYSG
ncbi:MAG: WecB/TagA/CpsF family glycosyltransferase [Methylomicrobium sp.]|nr:WecB/TagA/CpsF family glycosyltransferase [Methylomicrobium sp.]